MEGFTLSGVVSAGNYYSSPQENTLRDKNAQTQTRRVDFALSNVNIEKGLSNVTNTPLESLDTTKEEIQTINPENIPDKICFIDYSHPDLKYYRESILIFMYGVGSLLDTKDIDAKTKLFLADKVLKLNTTLEVLNGNNNEDIQKVIHGDCNPDTIRKEILQCEVLIHPSLAGIFAKRIEIPLKEYKTRKLHVGGDKVVYLLSPIPRNNPRSIDSEKKLVLKIDRKFRFGREEISSNRHSANALISSNNGLSKYFAEERKSYVYTPEGALECTLSDYIYDGNFLELIDNAGDFLEGIDKLAVFVSILHINGLVETDPDLRVFIDSKGNITCVDTGGLLVKNGGNELITEMLGKPENPNLVYLNKILKIGPESWDELDQDKKFEILAQGEIYSRSVDILRKMGLNKIFKFFNDVQGEKNNDFFKTVIAQYLMNDINDIFISEEDFSEVFNSSWIAESFNLPKEEINISNLYNFFVDYFNNLVLNMDIELDEDSYTPPHIKFKNFISQFKKLTLSKKALKAA